MPQQNIEVTPAEKPADSLNPFTFFREDRPLGDNPWPPNSSLWELFEDCTARTREKLDSLWTEFQQRHDPTAMTAPEILRLKLTARLTRLDIIVGQMLKACPPVDEAMALEYENWLEDLMGKERTAVLGLVNKGASSDADASIFLDFNEAEFTRRLMLKHQELKRAFHAERTRLIRGRRLAEKAAGTDERMATEGYAPVEPQVQSGVTETQEAPARQDLTHDDLVAVVVKNFGLTSGRQFVDFYKSLDVCISASEFAAWQRSDRKHCGKKKWNRLDNAARKLATKP